MSIAAANYIRIITLLNMSPGNIGTFFTDSTRRNFVDLSISMEFSATTHAFLRVVPFVVRGEPGLTLTTTDSAGSDVYAEIEDAISGGHNTVFLTPIDLKLQWDGATGYRRGSFYIDVTDIANTLVKDAIRQDLVDMAAVPEAIVGLALQGPESTTLNYAKRTTNKSMLEPRIYRSL
jgi:hypothetical protein